MRAGTWRRACHLQWLYFKIIVAELRWTLVVFALVNLVGALLFHAFYHLHGREGPSPDYVKSLHATFAMVFMEYTLEFPDHWALRVLYFLVPVLGLGAIADGLVRFGVLLFNRDANRDQWARVMAKALKDHVILCGLGRVGFRILEQLRRFGEDVVVIEKLDEQANSFVKEARRLGISVLVGDARREHLLEVANVAHAKSVIAATDDDLANLEIILDARTLRPGIRAVLRMFEHSMARKIGDAFDIAAVFSTADLAAPAFAAASSDRNILQSFYVEGTLLVIAQLAVREGSGLAGKSVADVKGQHRASVVARRPAGGEAEIIPGPESRLVTGDRITVQTRLEDMPALHQANGDTGW
ncbi:MAG: TrkA family potassium uptake protein [Planctomycetales bacterium]|nr:TrkA family potassium uptake protein [Planctomycetales bacterium]